MVSADQHTINSLFSENGLTDTFVDTDNHIIGGRNQQDHDKNLRHFKAVAKKYNLTINKDKCKYRLPQIKYWG